MARKEVLVQLDDQLVTELDRIAEERGVSRSELIRQGASALVKAIDGAKADEELIAAYKKQPQDEKWIEALMQASLETWPEY